MEQKKVIRDFKVLTEQISPDNVAVMAELIAMRETKALIGYYGYYAEKAHKNLCRDIFGKHEPGYIFSDSYDFVQSVALFLRRPVYLQKRQAENDKNRMLSHCHENAGKRPQSLLQMSML